MSKKQKRIIHSDTIALLPLFGQYGNLGTEIIEKTGTYRVDDPPFKL